MKKYIIRLIIKSARFCFRYKNYNMQLAKYHTKKVNLGCGLHCLPTWVNIDGSISALLGGSASIINKILYKLSGSSEFYEFSIFNDILKNYQLYWYDLSLRVPFKNDSVDIFFSSHFLEHLCKNDGANFLKEIYRSLKKGGLVRIAIPDLDIAVQQFNNEEDVESVLDLFFYTSDGCDFSSHKYNYNYKSISNLMAQIGFTSIKKLKYQVGDCPDIDYLDVYPEHSLYIEAYK